MAIAMSSRRCFHEQKEKENFIFAPDKFYLRARRILFCTPSRFYLVRGQMAVG